MDKPSDAKLVRAIRRWDLVAVAINSIIGAGIFGLPSEVFAKIGAYSLIAFIVCALVVVLIVLCFAEVGSRFSATGGPYLYAGAAFGPLAGFEVGWLLWIARISAYAANLNLLVGYLSFFWPQVVEPFWQTSMSIGGHVFTLALTGRSIVITLVTVSLTMVNVVGVRNAALVSNVSTIAKLTPIAVFIVVGLFFVDSHAYNFAARPRVADFSSSVLLLVYAFSGFEIATIPAGEVRNPRRDLPMALLTAMAVVATVYILIQVVCVGTLPELAQSKRPLADASIRFMGEKGAALIAVGALVSIIGNLNVLILAATRLPFAMSEAGDLPPKLGQTHPRFHTPHVSIAVTSAVLLVATLSGTFVYAATISTIARLLTYMATCVALLVLRRKADAVPALFKVPGAPMVSGAALLLSGWLLLNSTSEQAIYSAIAAGVGVMIYFAWRVARRGLT